MITANVSVAVTWAKIGPTFDPVTSMKSMVTIEFNWLWRQFEISLSRPNENLWARKLKNKIQA